MCPWIGTITDERRSCEIQVEAKGAEVTAQGSSLGPRPCRGTISSDNVIEIQFSRRALTGTLDPDGHIIWADARQRPTGAKWLRWS